MTFYQETTTVRCERRVITKRSPVWSKESGLDWTIAHGAGVFTDGPYTGRYDNVMLATTSSGKFLHSFAGEPMTPRSSTELTINHNTKGEIPCPDAQSHA
jgi:hypothetical protein